MSLQRKFVALLTVLALAVVVNLAATVWTLAFLQRELVRPLGDMQAILPKLAGIKREVRVQASLLEGGQGVFPFEGADAPPEPEGVRGPFSESSARVGVHVRGLEALDQYPALVGISTTRNLHERLRSDRLAAERWFDSGAEADREAAVLLLVRTHDLIERMEGNVTGSAASLSATGYAPAISLTLLIGIMASLTIVILAFTLGVILIRRWIVRPIGYLREATVELSKGTFSHRVPVTAQDELGHLSAEVNHMAGMISTMQEERVERERLAAAGEVVKRLAHNLRNPLAGIRSLAELSRTELPESHPTRDHQSRIVQTIDRFERWLADVLGATAPLKLTTESVPVASWLDTVVEPMRPSAAAKSVRLDVDASRAPGIARFDPRHLEQAVVGIIINAIQASPRGGVVSIAAAANGESWELSIADQGPGVPAELLDKIFRPYFTTKRDGTGIGLAVAKQVADQHSGRIWVEPGPNPVGGSESGPGARFVVKLPLAGPTEVANTGQSGPVDGARFGQDSDSRR